MSNKISVDIFKATVDGNSVYDTAAIRWHGVDVEIKPQLSLSDVLRFVNNVVNYCFVNDEYMPEMKDFIIRCGVLGIYANFELPQDINERYEYVMKCDAIENIMDVIDRHQFGRIMEAIDKRIDAKVQENISTAVKQANEILVSLRRLTDELGGAFKDIDGQQVSAFINALIDGKFDESKLAEATLALNGKLTEGEKKPIITVVKEDDE